MHVYTAALAAGALILALASSAVAAEQIDNPVYTAWAKFKPGTSVTDRTEDVTDGVTTVTLNKTTVVEVAPEKVVLEVESTASRNGRTVTMPATRLDIAARQDKPAQPASAPAQPNATRQESVEEIDVAGRKVKAKAVSSVSTVGGVTTKSKIWTSDDLPGTTMKMEMTTEGPQSKSSMTITVVEMTIK